MLVAVQLTPAEQLWSATEQTAAETMTSLTCLLAVVAAAAVVVVGLFAVRVVAEWVLAAAAVVTLYSVAVVTAVVAG